MSTFPDSFTQLGDDSLDSVESVPHQEEDGICYSGYDPSQQFDSFADPSDHAKDSDVTAKLLLGDALKEGTPISVNPLVIWAWAGVLINSINSIPAGELDEGRISFAKWGRKASARFTALSARLLRLLSLFNDVAFYWVVLIFILQRGPKAQLSEEITNPDDKYVALGILALILGLLVCLPYPFPFTFDSINTDF